MFGRGFFFFDVFVDQPRHAAASEAARRLIFSFAFGIAHKSFIERLLGADEIVLVKGQLAAFATLQIFRHGLPFNCCVAKRILVNSGEVNKSRLEK